MATHFTTGTISPAIATQLVSGLERKILESFGFACDEDEQTESLFFYADDLNTDGCLVVSMSDVLGDESDVARKLLRELRERGAVGPEYSLCFTELNDIGITIEGVCQQILLKPNNHDLDEIIIEGAWTCSKMEMGAFGGWVSRVTRDAIQFGSTDELVNGWRAKEAAPLPVVKLDDSIGFQ